MLHGYSAHNTLLIAQQAHARGIEPTYVAGFKAWLRLGRCVRRGERGLRVWAPMQIKKLDEHGQETDERALRFRLAAVFNELASEKLPEHVLERGREQRDREAAERAKDREDAAWYEEQYAALEAMSPPKSARRCWWSTKSASAPTAGGAGSSRRIRELAERAARAPAEPASESEEGDA